MATGCSSFVAPIPHCIQEDAVEDVMLPTHRVLIRVRWCLMVFNPSNKREYYESASVVLGKAATSAKFELDRFRHRP